MLWPEYCLRGISYFYYPTILVFSVYFLFALFSDEPEVFLPEYSQPAILHAAHFRRVVNPLYGIYLWRNPFISRTLIKLTLSLKM